MINKINYILKVPLVYFHTYFSEFQLYLIFVMLARAMAVCLKDRTFVSSMYQKVPVSSERPSSYKAWDEERLMRAYTAVKENKMSCRQAAICYDIPKSTLSDRVSGRVTFGSHSGPKRYLSDEEETHLVYFLGRVASLGYAKTKKEVLAVVEEMVAAKGKEVHVSNGWWESFHKRHPILSLRSAEKVSYARLVATDPQIISSLLEQTLSEYNLFESPAQIFNCDETGIPLEHTPPSVIGIKGQKHPRSLTTGNKRNITVMACCNATGFFIPPLVIFRRKALNRALVEGEVAGTMYGLNDRGWMDYEVFDNWSTHHFLRHAPPMRPLLLLLDGHSTHYHPGFISKAACEQVIVFCLPPNTTHLIQPLDKGVFGPLKTYWHQACQEFMRKNHGQVVTEYSFNKIFSKAWGQAMTIPNAMAAFRTTGVYPFNRSAVNVTDSTEKYDQLSKDAGLPFFPVLTPASRTPLKSADQGRRVNDRDENSSDSQLSTDSYHDSPPLTHSIVPCNLLLRPKESSLKKFFPTPRQIKKPLFYEKTTAKVLTSAEFRKGMEEKERSKREKQLEKEKRKHERERKKVEKEKQQSKRKNTIKTGKYQPQEDDCDGKILVYERSILVYYVYTFICHLVAKHHSARKISLSCNSEIVRI